MVKAGHENANHSFSWEKTHNTVSGHMQPQFCHGIAPRKAMLSIKHRYRPSVKNYCLRKGSSRRVMHLIFLFFRKETQQ